MSDEEDKFDLNKYVEELDATFDGDYEDLDLDPEVLAELKKKEKELGLDEEDESDADS